MRIEIPPRQYPAALGARQWMPGFMKLLLKDSDFASAGGHEQIAKLLLDKAADASSGLRGVQLPATSKIVSCCLKKGANVNALAVLSTKISDLNSSRYRSWPGPR